jgi:NAD(P)-dependent dehydrogenase (short-subunit alcohol dehydrogenase family)
MDVADPREIARAAGEVDEALGGGGLSLLVNNAAMTGAPGPVECVDIDAFKYLMEVNFWGPLRVTQAFLPLLRRAHSARIIMVSSASIYLTIPLGCTYPTSKSALATLTQHLRMELAPLGIQVTDLQPGGVSTPMTAFSDEEEVACWEALPPHLLEYYRGTFPYPGKILEAGFEFESPEAFADRVYRRIITAKRLAPVYVMGKGVGFLPFLHRLLPVSAVERFWKRFFRLRSGA